MEMQNLEFALMDFSLWSNISSICYLSSLLEWPYIFCAIVCWKRVIGSLILVLQLRDFLESQKRHGLRTLKQGRDYEKLGELLSWTECSFHYDRAASLEGPGRLDENCLHRLIHLHAKFSVKWFEKD